MTTSLIVVSSDASSLAQHLNVAASEEVGLTGETEFRWEQDLTDVEHSHVVSLISLEHDVPASKIARWQRAYPRLETLSLGFSGYDRVDRKAVAAAGLVARYAPGYSSRSTAELGLTLTLAVLRKVSQADRSVREGDWDSGGIAPGRELESQCVGVLGTGRIGHASARLFLGLGCEVIGSSRERRSTFTDLGATYELDREAFFERSDIVLVHLPQSPETAGYVSRERLKLLGDGVLINVSRAGVVDNVALADALVAGELFGAGIDVFEDDPIIGAAAALNDPLLSLSTRACNLVVTPHLGFKTEASLLRLAKTVLRNACKPVTSLDEATLVPFPRTSMPLNAQASTDGGREQNRVSAVGRS